MNHTEFLSKSNPRLVFLDVRLRKELSDRQYREHDGVNQSYLKRVHTHGVAHAEADKNSVQAQSKALLIGSLYHCITLEPREIDERYIIAPNVDRRTKYGKSVHDEFVESSNGLTVVKQEDFNVAEAMAKSATAIIADRLTLPKVAFEIAFTGSVKIEYNWGDKEYNFPFLIKGKLDMVCANDGHKDLEIIDLKSMASLSNNDVIASARGSCWGIQSAFYSDCLNEIFKVYPKFTYICSEKEEPNLSREFYVSKEMIERGRHNYLRSFVEIAEWHRHGKPSDYGHLGVTELNA